MRSFLREGVALWAEVALSQKVDVLSALNVGAVVTTDFATMLMVSAFRERKIDISCNICEQRLLTFCSATITFVIIAKMYRW